MAMNNGEPGEMAAVGQRDVHGVTGRVFRDAARLLPDNPAEEFGEDIPFIECVSEPRLLTNLKNMGYTHATVAQSAMLAKFNENESLFNAHITAPFNSGKTLSFGLPLVLHILGVKKKTQAMFDADKDLMSKTRIPGIQDGSNILGNTCHAVVVCHSQDLAVQTYNELVDLTDGMGISVLLCRAALFNSPTGNLKDIASGLGHIVVATIGRAKTLNFFDMNVVYCGPQGDKALADPDRALLARNALIHPSLFSTVSHLVIDECNFIFDLTKDDKKEDIKALRQLTTFFSDSWTLHMLRAVVTKQLERLPCDATTPPTDIETFLAQDGDEVVPCNSADSSKNGAESLGEDQPKPDGNWGTIVETCDVANADDWFALTTPEPVIRLDTVNDYSYSLPKLILRQLGDDFVGEDGQPRDFENAFYNTIADMIVKNLFYKSDGLPGKNVVIFQHRKTLSQFVPFLLGDKKFLATDDRVGILSSDCEPWTRDQALEAFVDPKSGCSVLVSTTALIRGMNIKADRFIVAECPKAKEDTPQSHAGAMEDLLTSINRGGRNTDSNDVVVIFGSRDWHLAHHFRNYIVTVAMCADDDHDYPSEIMKMFPEDYKKQLNKRSWGKTINALGDVTSGEDDGHNEAEAPEASGEDAAAAVVSDEDVAAAIGSGEDAAAAAADSGEVDRWDSGSAPGNW